MSNPDLYTIGWICTLSFECVAAKVFLDEEHPALESQDQHDSNCYTLGRINKHNVVIALLPRIHDGSSAAISVANLLRTFKNIDLGVFVGLGGGAPTRENDIRLGDVVVNIPSDDSSGTCQYEYGDLLQSRPFQQKGPLKSPPEIFLSAVTVLRGNHERFGNSIEERISEVLQSNPHMVQNGYGRPNIVDDLLFQSHVAHQGDKGCSCRTHCYTGDDDIVSRSMRRDYDDDPAVFYGVIASADTIMQDANARDRLAAEKGVLCYETQAVGLISQLGCLVVCGISSYADTHRNDVWQRYAAMTAAAYTKEILTLLIPAPVQIEPT